MKFHDKIGRKRELVIEIEKDDTLELKNLALYQWNSIKILIEVLNQIK